MKIKTIIILFFFVIVCDKSKSQYLFNVVNLTAAIIQTANEGGYEGQVTLINKSLCYVHGIKVAWHAGERWTIGTNLQYGNNIVPNLMSNQRYKITNISTGIYLEYVQDRTKKRYWSIPFYLSYGGYFIAPEYVPGNNSGSSSAITFEPRAQYAFNLTNRIQANASIGYRIVQAGRLYGTNNAFLGGPSVNFSLILGNFDK